MRNRIKRTVATGFCLLLKFFSNANPMLDSLIERPRIEKPEEVVDPRLESLVERLKKEKPKTVEITTRYGHEERTDYRLEKYKVYIGEERYERFILQFSASEKFGERIFVGLFNYGLFESKYVHAFIDGFHPRYPGTMDGTADTAVIEELSIWELKDLVLAEILGNVEQRFEGMFEEGLRPAGPESRDIYDIMVDTYLQIFPLPSE